MDDMACEGPDACASCFHLQGGTCALRALILEHIGALPAYPGGLALA